MAMEICRTCLAVDVTLYSMFDTKGPSQTDGFVADMLGQITKTPPQPSDEISSKVCIGCVTEIDRCFNFKTKCDTSERMLRNVLVASRRCNSVVAAPTIKTEVIDLADDSDDSESETEKTEPVAADSDSDCEIVQEESDAGSYYIITSIEEGSPTKPGAGQQQNSITEKLGLVSAETSDSATTSGHKGSVLPQGSRETTSGQQALEQGLSSSVNEAEVINLEHETSRETYNAVKQKTRASLNETTQSIAVVDGKNVPREFAIPPKSAEIKEKVVNEQREQVQTITSAKLIEIKPKLAEKVDKVQNDQRKQVQTINKSKQNDIQTKSSEKPDTSHHIPRDKSQKVICPYCKAMHSGLSVKSHILANHVANGQPFSCPLCGKKLDDKAQHDAHILYHKTHKTFDCKHCYRSFLSNSELEYHVLIRHGNINSSTGSNDLPTTIKPAGEERVQGIPTKRKTSPTVQGTTHAANESIEVNIDQSSCTSVGPTEKSKSLANQTEQPPKTTSPKSNTPSHDSFQIFSCKQCFDVFFSRKEIESHILSGDCESTVTSKRPSPDKSVKRVVEASVIGTSHAKKPKRAQQERPSAESPDSNPPAIVYNIALHAQHPESVAVSKEEKTPPAKASPLQSDKPANTNNISGIFSCKQCVRAYISKKDLNAHIRMQHPKSPTCEPFARLLPNTPGYYLTQPIVAPDQPIYANYEKTTHDHQRNVPQASHEQGALLSNECTSFQDTIGAQGLPSTTKGSTANTSMPRVEIPINAVPPLNYSNLRVNSVHYLTRQSNCNTPELLQRQIAPPNNSPANSNESNTGKQYRCKNCLRVFESEQLSELHAKLNWCLRVKDFAKIQTHWEDEQSQPLTCSFCSITFASKQAISKHACTSICESNFLCKFCEAHIAHIALPYDATKDVEIATMNMRI